MSASRKLLDFNKHANQTYQMEIGFIGAAQTVIGSKFLVHHDETQVLVDCGMFQGLKDLRLLNWSGFPFDPAKLKAVILTHAHVDHCGALPLLVKKGFKGPIYCSDATLALTEIILLDSAKIQEEDAQYANKKGFSKHEPALALYTTEDVEKTLPLLRSISLNQSVSVGSLSFAFFNAGHILGACSVIVKSPDKSVYFSGDLGRSNDPLMWAPEAPKAADFIVMESTYGNKVHSDIPSKEILKECIFEIQKNKSVLLIPSFAVGRSQNIIFELVELKRQGEIPSNIPIYLNTPMGEEVCALYERFNSYHRLGAGQFAEIMAEIRSIKSTQESKNLNDRPEGPMIIVAASGMLTGGRVLHHLKALADNPKNILLLAGFQSPGTRGRKLIDGEKELKIHGMMIDINCQIVSSDSFSAHADQRELINWLKNAETPPKHVFLVHGESETAQIFADKISQELNLSVSVPHHEQFINLNEF